jgi:hypothetical protein
LPLSYYVYYRVGDASQASALAHELLSAIKQQTGIAGRLLRKRDDPATWMEIYEGVQDAPAFERSLAECVEAIRFTGVLQSGSARHIECFEEPCD